MPERRSSRSLREVSHLFLSESRPPRTETCRGTARVWLAVADASLNRAHFATGLAAAFVLQGMRVSLLEVCGNLPTIGYYFGMERGEYLRPALDRSALVSGSWNGAVRYCFSSSVSSFGRYRGGEPDGAAPHAIIVAFPYPPRRNAAPFLAALREASAVCSGEAAPGGCPPDAFIVAGSGEGGGGTGACAAGMQKAFPRAAGYLVANRFANEDNALERIVLPADVRRSWARRIPPEDPWFGELVAGLLQLVSVRRRGTVSYAARG